MRAEAPPDTAIHATPQIGTMDGTAGLPEVEAPATKAVASQVPDRIIILAGALSMALGAAVLVGWHFGIPFLIQVLPGLTPMARSTAVTFVVFGAALGALGLGRQSVAALAAAAGGLIALIRLVQYVTGVTRQVETVGSPVSMAPNTALGCAFIAGAICLCSLRREFRWKELAVAFCGSVGAALGLNSLIGYLTGLQTYMWINFRPMAVHTAVGLIVLGSAVLIFSWRQTRGVGTDWPQWGPVVVGVAGIVSAVSVWQALQVVERLHRESIIRFDSTLPETVLFFGLVVTILLSAAVYFAGTARRRAAVAEHLRGEADREAAERQLVLDSLAASEWKYRTLLENLPQKIALKDRNSVYLSCNQNYAADLGIPPETIVGKTDYDFYPQDLVCKYRADDQRVMQSGVTVEIEEEYLVHGEMSWVQTVKTPVRDERGEVAGVLAIFWDVTDRKRVQESLRLAALYNRGLIESSLDPLVTIASDGKITDVNRATEQVTGCTREELIGADFCDFFSDPEKARQGYQQVFRDGAVQNYELQIRRRDGHLTPVLYNASVYRDAAGSVVGVFAAARDITDRKRAEEALQLKALDLERSNADLEQFAYVASHDLQEPLRMVANFTQLLADRYGDRVGADGAEFIAYAVDGATRMQRLIQDLLTYSRVGTRGKAFEAIDCNEILGAAVANLQVAIQQSGAIVTHEELPTIMADGSQLVQLFQNLLGNAIKFQTEASPRVHISARRELAQWLFSVRDNGIGIDPQFSNRIFVIFQRLHSREEFPGTGIGLALCKKIVERHGGKIWVESSPGAGSTFFFTIPATSATPAQGRVQQGGSHG